MAESYAQMALSRSALKGPQGNSRSAGGAAGAAGLADLEDKILSLAQLLRSSQACQEEADAQHRGAAAELASRVEQLEELLQRQLADSTTSSGATVDAYTIRAVAERLTLLERHLGDGLSENHSAHTHNAAAFAKLEARLAALEAAPARSTQDTEDALLASGGIASPIMAAVERKLERFEREVQARLVMAATPGASSAHKGAAVAAAGTRADPWRAAAELLDNKLAGFEKLLHCSMEALANAPHEPAPSERGARADACVDARVESLVDGRMQQLLGSFQQHVQDMANEVASLRCEMGTLRVETARVAAESAPAKQLVALQARLRALGGAHAAAGAAAVQLGAVAPELRRLVVEMQAATGREGGKCNTGTAGTAAMLAKHTQALAKILAKQLERAAALAADGSGDESEAHDGRTDQASTPTSTAGGVDGVLVSGGHNDAVPRDQAPRALGQVGAATTGTKYGSSQDAAAAQQQRQVAARHSPLPHAHAQLPHAAPQSASALAEKQRALQQLAHELALVLRPELAAAAKGSGHVADDGRDTAAAAKHALVSARGQPRASDSCAPETNIEGGARRSGGGSAVDESEQAMLLSQPESPGCDSHFAVLAAGRELHVTGKSDGRAGTSCSPATLGMQSGGRGAPQGMPAQARTVRRPGIGSEGGIARGVGGSGGGGGGGVSESAQKRHERLHNLYAELVHLQ